MPNENPETKAVIPQGTLDLLILKTLRPGPLHGLGVSRRIEQVTRGVFRVTPGSLFPALHRLEQQGWIAAHWRTSETGRDARFYRLTAAGRKRLNEELANWERLSRAVGLVIRHA